MSCSLRSLPGEMAMAKQRFFVIEPHSPNVRCQNLPCAKTSEDMHHPLRHILVFTFTLNQGHQHRQERKESAQGLHDHMLHFMCVFFWHTIVSLYTWCQKHNSLKKKVSWCGIKAFVRIGEQAVSHGWQSKLCLALCLLVRLGFWFCVVGALCCCRDPALIL